MKKDSNRVNPLYFRDKLPYIIRNSNNHKFQEFPLALAQGIV